MFVLLCFIETDTDETTRVELTPARVIVQFVFLSGMKQARVGPSSSPGAKSPVGPTGTGQAPALPLLLTETENLGTETR